MVYVNRLKTPAYGMNENWNLIEFVVACLHPFQNGSNERNVIAIGLAL